MATEKWTPGATPSFTTCMGSTDVNQTGFASGSSVLSTVVVNNPTNMDIFADISVYISSIITTITAPAISGLAIFIYPFNQDGATYGDNTLGPAGTVKAVTPASQYWVGNIIFPVNGTATACVGQLNRIIMPPGYFSFAIQNLTGSTLATSGNAISYRTYNRAIA